MRQTPFSRDGSPGDEQADDLCETFPQNTAPATTPPLEARSAMRRTAIRYEAQRRPILKILTSVAGVLGVVDRLPLEPRKAIS
jgi:hypothetical protein